jgi:DNA-binding transcriptional ArsR family regulator
MTGRTAPLRRAADVAKALAHPTRLRILGMLREGDLCVCQIAAVLELAPSTVSAHLADLRRVGLLAERKQGRWVHYSLARHPALGSLLGNVLAAIKDDPRIREDDRLVRKLRRVPADVLCRAGLDLEAVGVRPVTAGASAGEASAAPRR